MSGAAYHRHAGWVYGPIQASSGYIRMRPNPSPFSFGSFQMAGSYFVHHRPVQGQAFCMPTQGVANADAYMRQVPYAQHMATMNQTLGLAGPHSNMHTVWVPPSGGIYGACRGPGPGFSNVPGGYFWPGPHPPNKTPMDGGAVWCPHAPMPADRYYAQGGRGLA